MTRDEAARLVGNQPKVCLRNMALALSLHSWSNTPDEWQRLRAACVVLGRAAPRQARAALKHHLEQQAARVDFDRTGEGHWTVFVDHERIGELVADGDQGDVCFFPGEATTYTERFETMVEARNWLAGL